MKTHFDIQAISPRSRVRMPFVTGRSSPPFNPIVAVGNVKGGVGKTTLAVNLAICDALYGTDVLLIDGDEQGTARAFTQLRAEVVDVPGYTAVSLRGGEIRTQVRQLRSKYERILIDVGGRDTASLRAALTVAGVLVVPVLPATFDMWSLDPLQNLILEAREINPELRTIVILNAADPFGKDNDEAAAIIREKEGLEYFPHPIVRRKAFRNAAAAGLSVLEYRPVDEKAVREFGLLAAHLFGYAGDIASISHGNRKTSPASDKDERQAG